MKLIKLTALPLLLFVTLLAFTSCEPDAELKKITEFQKLGIVMSGAQETPAVPSSSLGSMDVFYSRDTRILSYKINWSGLTGNPVGMHVHGQAPVGFAAGVYQSISTSGLTATGSKSGTLLVDGVTIKEQDLLNGFYYINIHTATYPGGEIRGQIKFQ